MIRMERVNDEHHATNRKDLNRCLFPLIWFSCNVRRCDVIYFMLWICVFIYGQEWSVCSSVCICLCFQGGPLINLCCEICLFDSKKQDANNISVLVKKNVALVKSGVRS